MATAKKPTKSKTAKATPAKAKSAKAKSAPKAAKKPKAARESKAKKTEGAPQADPVASSPHATVAHYQLLESPILTEKTAMVSSDRNRAVFRVPRQATKLEIKAAVEAIFQVKVDKVRTVNVMGKVKRTRGSLGRTPSFKKAYVTMKEGHTINIVEGV